MRHSGIRTGAALVLLAVGASCIDDDAADPAAEARSEPPTGESAAAPPTTADQPTATVAQPAAVAQAPVAVTACIEPGPYVGPPGTKERVEIPSSEGAILLDRYRGDTFLQPWTEVSDPRLEGTYTRSWDEDEYFSGGTAFLSIVVTTDRIENDDGAWQGTSVWYRPAAGDQSFAPVVMVGEGAYEGLTAILGGTEAYDCTVSGYIIEGSIPAPPMPPSDQ
jgi:hypothetical protein